MTGTDQAWALQQAVYAALAADPALIAALGGARIYDRVPGDAELPCVTLGEDMVTDWSAGSVTGLEHRLRFHVWAREGGRKTVRAVAAAIHAVLHDAALTLSAGHLVNLRFLTARTRVDPDGETWHGVLDYRAVTESA